MPGSEEQGGRRGGQWERFEGLRCSEVSQRRSAH